MKTAFLTHTSVQEIQPIYPPSECDPLIRYKVTNATKLHTTKAQEPVCPQHKIPTCTLQCRAKLFEKIYHFKGFNYTAIKEIE